MEQLSQFTLLVRHAVFGYLNGLHKSRRLGGAGDFMQYRPYTPGDDLRYTDWKLFARHDRLYQKICQEDSSTKVGILLDNSPSMLYPQQEAATSSVPSKYAYASMLAASLFHIARLQNDAPAILTTSAGFLPAATAPARVLDMLAKQPDGKAAFSEEAVGALLRYLEGSRGIAIIISDFIDVPLEHTLKLLNANRLNVFLAHLIHPDELNLPFSMPVNFKDAESGRTIASTPDAFRDHYVRKINLFLEETKKTAWSNHAVYTLANCSVPLLNTLAKLLN